MITPDFSLLAGWLCTCGIRGHGQVELSAHMLEHLQIETAIRAAGGTSSDFPLPITTETP